MQTTDIVMDTAGNRLPLLRRSIEAIFERTTSPYRLRVIDDASTDGTAAYLRKLYRKGKTGRPLIRRKRLGIPANWNAIPRMTASDIVVYTNGDVLCPKTNPDWLVFGLKALARNPDIGMLSLNSPMCNAKRVLKIISRSRKGVVITDRVPSFFLFIRRDLMLKIRLPKVGGKIVGIPMTETYAKIDHMWSRMARRHGYQVGYLSGIYCWHFGTHSLRNDRNLSHWIHRPMNPDTLEPQKRFKG